MNYARPLEQMIPIRDLNDIRIIESVPWESRNLPKTPLQILRHSARAFGDNTAIEYISSATDNSPVFSLTYSKFYDRVMRIANLFDRLGIGKDDVVSMLLPNLPHTHYILWGAQAAGIVNPINPFLESSQIAAIMRKAGTKILVVLSPDYDPDIWTKTMQAVNGVPQVETLFIVDEQRLYSNKPSCVLNEIRDRNELRENIALLDLDDEMNAVKPEQVRERASDEITAYFHTGGTTGMPKLAMWAGSNQVYMAWTIATIGHFSNASAGLCGLPLFHASAVMVTGLAPFLAGAKVIIATASGCRNPEVIKNFWKLVER
ncbi:MAG TPA: acyl-CoA synthetase, partial [Sphingomonadales bacterium]|nr:acyl-CoA synthetase [Sphingomonadales bacterium]